MAAAKQRNIYEAVLKAQLAAYQDNYIVAGDTCLRITSAALRTVEEIEKVMASA
jgi:hypothetical protein